MNTERENIRDGRPFVTVFVFLTDDTKDDLDIDNVVLSLQPEHFTPSYFLITHVTNPPLPPSIDL